MNGNGGSAIMPGSAGDPSVWFLGWLQESLSSGSIAQNDWLMQIDRLWRSACAMHFDHWNASVATIRDFMTRAGMEIPAEFPAQISKPNFDRMRAEMACPVVVVESVAEKVARSAALAIAAGTLLGLGGLWIWVKTRGPKAKRRRKPRRLR